MLGLRDAGREQAKLRGQPRCSRTGAGLNPTTCELTHRRRSVGCVPGVRRSAHPTIRSQMRCIDDHASDRAAVLRRIRRPRPHLARHSGLVPVASPPRGSRRAFPGRKLVRRGGLLSRAQHLLARRGGPRGGLRHQDPRHRHRARQRPGRRRRHRRARARRRPRRRHVRRAAAPQHHRLRTGRRHPTGHQRLGRRRRPVRRRVVRLGAHRRPSRLRQRHRRHRGVGAQGEAGRLVVRRRLRSRLVAGGGVALSSDTLPDARSWESMQWRWIKPG